MQIGRNVPFVLIPVLATALLTIAAEAAATPEAAPHQVEEIDRHILDARRQIKRAIFVVHRVWNAHAEPRHQEDTTTIWLDGDKVREDRKTGQAVNTVSYGDHDFFWYNNAEALNGSNVSLVLRDAQLPQTRKQWNVRHPLNLMLFPLWFAAGDQLQMEAYIGSAARYDFQCVPESWQGHPSYKVSYRRAETGSQVTYWVAPDRAYSVYRIQLEWLNDRDRYIDANEATLAEVSPGIWFPATILYTRHVNGNLLDQENLDIATTSVNEPIDATMYTPASMHVPAGTHVDKVPRDRRGDFIWNGSQLVLLSPDDMRRRLAVAQFHSEDGRRLLFLAVSGLLGLIAVALIWMARRRDRALTSQE